MLLVKLRCSELGAEPPAGETHVLIADMDKNLPCFSNPKENSDIFFKLYIVCNFEFLQTQCGTFSTFGAFSLIVKLPYQVRIFLKPTHKLIEL